MVEVEAKLILFGVILLIAVIFGILITLYGLSFLHSIGLYSVAASVASNRFLYINTYSYANGQISQMPTSLPYSFSGTQGPKFISSTQAGTCTTTISTFNPGYQVLEVDLPLSNNTFPVNQRYASPGQQNVQLAICQILLPANYTNTTTGYLTIGSGGTQISMSISSIYQQNSAQPLLVTVPTSQPQTQQQATTTIAQGLPNCSQCSNSYYCYQSGLCYCNTGSSIQGQCTGAAATTSVTSTTVATTTPSTVATTSAATTTVQPLGSGGNSGTGSGFGSPSTTITCTSATSAGCIPSSTSPGASGFQAANNTSSIFGSSSGTSVWIWIAILLGSVVAIILVGFYIIISRK